MGEGDTDHLNEIVLRNFPDERNTKIVLDAPVDQRGEPIPSGYTIVLVPDTHPSPATVEKGGRLTIDISNGTYQAIISDPRGKERGREIVSNVQYGGRRALQRQINLKNQE